MARSSGDGTGELLVGLGLAGLAVAFVRGTSRPAPPALDHTFHRVLGELTRVCEVLATGDLPFDRPALTVGDEEPTFAIAGNHVRCNRQWVDDLLARYCRSEECRSALLVGMLGHEVAHRRFGHPGYTDACATNHLQELQADAVAGWVLAATGFPPEYLSVVLRELSVETGCSHPPGDLRAQAIHAGYQHALEGRDWSELRYLRVVG